MGAVTVWLQRSYFAMGLGEWFFRRIQLLMKLFWVVNVGREW